MEVVSVAHDHFLLFCVKKNESEINFERRKRLYNVEQWSGGATMFKRNTFHPTFCCIKTCL